MTSTRLFDRVFAPVGRLVAALSDPARRERTVVVVLLAYVAIWTLYGVLAKGSQDIHTDMAEVFAWSRELALGYTKHPPLAAWLTAAWFLPFPVTDWAFYLLAMATVGVALWIAWHLAGDYLDGEKRVLALAALMLVPFFNFHALKFNPNTVLLPLWAATTLCFLRSFEKRSAIWAALAGLFAAGAMLGKYWSVFLLMGLVAAALLDSRRAAYFRSAAPWITVAVGSIVLAPHLVWLVHSDFAPINYANVVHAAAKGGALSSIGEYLAGSLAYIAFPLVLLLAVMRPGPTALLDIVWPATAARRLAILAFAGPLLLPVLAPVLFDFKIASLWSMSAWTLLPVVLLASPLVSIHRDAMLTTVGVAIVLPALMVAAAPLIAGSVHRGSTPLPFEHSRLLAERVLHEWRSVTDKPLKIVGGDGDFAFGAAFYLPGRTSVFPDSNFVLAPWIDRARLRRDGIAIICGAGDSGCVARSAALGLTGPSTDVEISRLYHGVPGRVGRYKIIIVAPKP